MKNYLLSQEGADYYNRTHAPETPAEAGQVVSLELTDEQERALIAAGWLEVSKKKEG